jgi:hypothetical protein
MAALVNPMLNERWEYFQRNGKMWARVSGRTPIPASYKNNPVWWTQNSFDQTVDHAPWYHPDWPEWRRVLYWSYFRNPGSNGKMFVAGVCDQNYEVEPLEGNPDVLVVQRDDVTLPSGRQDMGVQSSRIHLPNGTTRDWYSYTSAHLVLDMGTQPSGVFEVKTTFR